MEFIPHWLTWVRPEVLKNFQSTGKMPIIYIILSSNNRQVQMLYEVFRVFNMRFSDYV